MSFTWPKEDAWIALDAYMENKHLTGEVSQWSKVMRDVYATKEESGFIGRFGSNPTAQQLKLESKRLERLVK